MKVRVTDPTHARHGAVVDMNRPEALSLLREGRASAIITAGPRSAERAVSQPHETRKA
jgi:hypothetical protein